MWRRGLERGGEWLLTIGIVVLIAAAVLLVVYVLRNADGGRQAQTNAARGWQPNAYAPAQTAARETPRDILQRRYAAGEIKREEYLQKLADL